jgi:ubiquitin C-terminal hydrolase
MRQPQGLVNSSNNCWANALLQFLMHARQFRTHISNTSELAQLLNAILHKEINDPGTRLRQLCMYDSGNLQEDAAEALALLFSQLEAQDAPLNITTVTEFAVAQRMPNMVRGNLTCLGIDRQQRVDCKSWMISVTALKDLVGIPESNMMEVLFGWRSATSDSDAWRCWDAVTNCAAQCVPIRTKDILHKPCSNTLIFVLQRMNNTHAMTDKFSEEIHMPELFDQHRLTCMIQHYGSSQSGHYVAFVRDTSNGPWWRCDDCAVTPVTELQFAKERSTAYVYCYETEQKASASNVQQAQSDQIQQVSSDTSAWKHLTLQQRFPTSFQLFQILEPF